MSRSDSPYVVCLDNTDYAASLEVRKIYRRIPDEVAEADGFVRVIDESDEDYVYPARSFAAIEVPKAVDDAFAGARRTG
jgi:hypothetical protein